MDAIPVLRLLLLPLLLLLLLAVYTFRLTHLVVAFLPLLIDSNRWMVEYGWRTR